jgi:acetylornithine/N-succinyldiaminopimelate aminotransferase
MSETIMSTYARLDVTFTRGEGSWLWDSNDKKYLDALTGIAVCGLGHANPAVAEAICKQATTLVHTSNLYKVENQQKLADRLIALSGLSNVFFANSGAEANEAAIKMARMFGHKKGIEKPVIAVMENSFHGRTLATLSATGNRKVQAGFEPLVQGFARIPYNDSNALENAMANDPNIVAVLLEPVQGETGIRIPKAGYLQKIREICDKHDCLMMLDEVQTGIGRSGKMFAFQHEGIKPDVMSLAKGLGNGVPIGACLAGEKAAHIFGPGNHGSTFGGNPLACSAALAVLDQLETRQLPQRATELGKRICDGLRQELEGVQGIREIRGLGLLMAVELACNCTELVKMGVEDGLLINVCSESNIRLLPPLTMSDEEADLLVDKLTGLIWEFLNTRKTGQA